MNKPTPAPVYGLESGVTRHPLEVHHESREPKTDGPPCDGPVRGRVRCRSEAGGRHSPGRRCECRTSLGLAPGRQLRPGLRVRRSWVGVAYAGGTVLRESVSSGGRKSVPHAPCGPGTESYRDHSVSGAPPLPRRLEGRDRVCHRRFRFDGAFGLGRPVSEYRPGPSDPLSRPGTVGPFSAELPRSIEPLRLVWRPVRLPHRYASRKSAPSISVVPTKTGDYSPGDPSQFQTPPAVLPSQLRRRMARRRLATPVGAEQALAISGG